MTSERAKMLYYEQLYNREKYLREGKQTTINHLQGWLAIVAGSWLATAVMLIWIIWAVL